MSNNFAQSNSIDISTFGYVLKQRTSQGIRKLKDLRKVGFDLYFEQSC